MTTGAKTWVWYVCVCPGCCSGPGPRADVVVRTVEFGDSVIGNSSQTLRSNGLLVDDVSLNRSSIRAGIWIRISSKGGMDPIVDVDVDVNVA